jgi:hypothetical protein
MTAGITESPATGIGKLLNESRFVVPSHQRDYSWTEDQVDQLFDDIEAAMDARYNEYFLGLVVFQGGQDEELTVLDGQQRLATVVIILAAIRDWLRQYSEYLDDAQSIQHAHIGRRDLGAREVQPRLALSTANNPSFIECVVGSVPLEDIIEKKNSLKRQDRSRRLLEAVIVAHERVKKIAQAAGPPAQAAEKLFGLVKFIRDNARVIRLIVTNAGIAYTIFETLNDRGIDLSPLDLVKNHAFSKAASQSPATLRDMEARWMQMMATLASVRSVGNFLKAFWTSRHGRIRSTNLFDELSDKYPDSQSAIVLSIDMLVAAEFYSALEVSDDPVWGAYTRETRDTVRDLKILGWQLFYPVALSGLAKFDRGEMTRLLNLIEVIIVRHLLTLSGSTGKLETSAAILARKIYAEEVTTAAQAFQELKDYYPSDSDFKQFFATKTESSNQKAQYLLRCIEQEAIRQEQPLAEELSPGVLTVEHVMPKSPGEEWADVTANDPSLVEDNALRLGNMCLLTDVNNQLGRKNFAVKKEVYKTSRLITTRAIAEYERWDRQAIHHHQSWLAKLAAATWRFQ